MATAAAAGLAEPLRPHFADDESESEGSSTRERSLTFADARNGRNGTFSSRKHAPSSAARKSVDWSHARVLVPQASWRGYRSGVRLSVDAEEGQPGPSLPQANSDLGFDAPPPAGRTKQDVWDRMRMYRRTSFTCHDWVEHRSIARYGRHIYSMLRSGIVRSLAGPCLFFTILSAAVVAYHDVQRFYFPRLPPPPYLTLAPFTLTSFALSLLLVFRTNSSYSRWWEARAQWGKVVNRSRDIVRMSLAYMDPDMAAVTVKWTKVFPIALKCHLRDDPTLKPKLARAGLTPRELDAVLAAKHHPNFILQVLASCLARAKLDPMIRVHMESNLTCLEDMMGGMERILKTPVPLFCTHHISRFITSWLFFLPFGLWASLGWGTVPATFILAFFLLGIDEIGVQIEEPYSILPLETIAAGIADNIDELVASNSVAQELAAATADAGLAGVTAPRDSEE